jgi:hypothetical protein
LRLRANGCNRPQRPQHVTENHGVGGSIPPLGTINSIFISLITGA